jgi:hypothetical protein
MGTKDRAKSDVEKKVSLRVYEYALNNLILVLAAAGIFQFVGSDRQFVYTAVVLLLVTIFGIYRGWKVE